MPIQWFKQPDGTWVLWNTEESQAQPMEVPPTKSGGAGLRGTDTSDVAAQMFEQQHQDWGKPTVRERKFVRDAAKLFHKGELTETESARLSESLVARGLVDVTDDGVWSKASLGHNEDQVKSFVKSMEQWREDAAGALTDRGYDTSKSSVNEILDYLRKEGMNLYQGDQ